MRSDPTPKQYFYEKVRHTPRRSSLARTELTLPLAGRADVTPLTISD